MLYLLIVVTSPVNTTLFLCSMCLWWLQAQWTAQWHYIILMISLLIFKPSEHYIIMLYLLIVVTSPVNTTLFLCFICYLLIVVTSPVNTTYILRLYVLIMNTLFAYSGYKPSEHYIIVILCLLIVVMNTTLFLCSICL